MWFIYKLKKINIYVTSLKGKGIILLITVLSSVKDKTRDKTSIQRNEKVEDKACPKDDDETSKGKRKRGGGHVEKL